MSGSDAALSPQTVFLCLLALALFLAGRQDALGGGGAAGGWGRREAGEGVEIRPAPISLQSVPLHGELHQVSQIPPFGERSWGVAWCWVSPFPGLALTPAGEALETSPEGRPC